MKKQISYKIVSLIFTILVVCFAIAFYAVAWVEPSGDSPIGNVPAPLNTSNIPQIKVGGLILNTGGAGVGLAVDQGKVGIGTLTPSTKLDIYTNPASTNTVEEMLRLTRETTGIAATGMGSSINFQLEIADGRTFPTGRIESVLTISPNLDADLVFYTRSGGSSPVEALRLHQRTVYGGAFFIDGLAVDGADKTLYVDSENNRVGIGANNPQSRLQVDDGYLQIDVVFEAPPVEDCDEDEEQGRMILYTGRGSNRLYVCANIGSGVFAWVSVALAL